MYGHCAVTRFSSCKDDLQPVDINIFLAAKLLNLFFPYSADLMWDEYSPAPADQPNGLQLCKKICVIF